MNRIKRIGLFLTLAIFLFGIVNAISGLSPLKTTETVSAQGLGNCTTGFDQKIEGKGPHVVNAPAGQVFTQVTIKAGSQNQEDGGCFTYTTNTNDGCYSVAGIGTGTLTVTKVGDGPDCKDISHIEVFWEPAGQGGQPETPPVTPPSGETQPLGGISGAPSAIAPVTPAAPEAGVGGAPAPEAGLGGAPEAGLGGAPTGEEIAGTGTGNWPLVAIVLSLLSGSVALKFSQKMR